jgi:type VI secretion system protein ImpF
MPRLDIEQPLVPSVLDRLVDLEPKISTEPPASRSRSLVQVKDAVKRDLEWLLNSRQVVADLPDDPGELGRSALTYGLPDLASASLNNPADQARLRRAIGEAIARFEPRLARVEVTLEPAREHERAIHFRIDALLKVEPEPEPVTFDSLLKLDTKSFVVRGDSP